jgi:hypothetical protein
MIKQRPPGEFSFKKLNRVHGPVETAINCCGFLQKISGLCNIKSFAVLVMALLLFNTAQAQNKTVSGKITDNITNDPVIGASVKVKSATGGVITDQQGMFKIDVPSGALLEITSIGYAPVEVRADFGK